MTKAHSTSDEDSQTREPVSTGGEIMDGGRAEEVSGRDRIVQTGGGAYIGGSVSTGGGNFIGRDQIKTVYPQAGGSVEDLLMLLREVRVLLPQASLDPDVADAIEGDFRVVEGQAGKAEPQGGLIKAKLKGIAGVIQETAKTSEAADKILGLLAKGAALAGALF